MCVKGSPVRALSEVKASPKKASSPKKAAKARARANASPKASASSTPAPISKEKLQEKLSKECRASTRRGEQPSPQSRKVSREVLRGPSPLMLAYWSNGTF